MDSHMQVYDLEIEHLIVQNEVIRSIIFLGSNTRCEKSLNSTPTSPMLEPNSSHKLSTIAQGEIWSIEWILMEDN